MRTKITTKYNTKNKETRIIVAQPFVVEHFLFKDESIAKKDKDYSRFINQLCAYTMAGRNKHDDAADAMSMMADYVQNFVTFKAQIVQRPW